MAISFSRPDPASPASVSSAQFSTSRRGYDQSEVRDFLRMVAAEQARLQERERFLERELRVVQQAGAPNMATIDEETAIRLLGEEAARVLQTAREAAGQIRVRAEEGSARLLREATDEAQRLREAAEIEAARRRQDAGADSEAELQMAKQQGRDMVNEARAYRERVLSELARRRELARQQIEQLIHGRDRLLQAFERSRLAAVEVMAELTPLGEPNEYVNLQPTTGPLPIMVPSSLASTALPVDAIAEDMVDEPFVDDSDSTVVLSLEPELVALADVVVLDFGPDVDLDDVRGTGIESDTKADSGVATEGDLGNWPAPHAKRVPDPDDSADADDTFEGGMEQSELRLVEPTGDLDAPSDDADSEAANVVELFAVIDATSGEPRTVSTGGESVDDLFARLRAARSDTLARKVAEEVAATPIEAETNHPAPDDTVQDAERDAHDGESPIDPEEVLVPLIVSVARKLKRVLADEQNDVLDTLRRKEPVRAIDALLSWEAEQTDRYADAVQGDLIAAAVAGARGGEDGKNPAIVGPASDAVTNEIVAPLRERLTRCIDKADGNNTDLANQVRSLYREWKTHRIDEHVEAIVRLAFERGALTVASS